MAIGAPVRRLAMAVVVARRAGLHAAATRFASAGRVPPGYAALRARVLRIEREVLAACRPGRSYADALAALDRSYAAAGYPGGWAGHYQGGPVGYAQREFEIAPGQRDSRWPAERSGPVTRSPGTRACPAGAKAEDTYLITDGGPERVTASGDWPTEPATTCFPGARGAGDRPVRPATSVTRELQEGGGA